MAAERVLKLLCGVVLASALLAFVACQTGAPAPAGGAERLLLVSYDALGADLLAQWREQGVLTEPDGLALLAERGFGVDRLVPVNPTLTAPNHLALASGRTPADTGIISNDFRSFGAPLNVLSSGFATTSAAPTLWQAARTHGRRVGVLLWPGADGGAFARMGDFGVMWPLEPLLASALMTLKPEQAEPLVELPSADGVAGLQWSVQVALPGAEPELVDVVVAAFDGEANGVPRYDQAAVRRAEDGSWSYVGEREWFQTTCQTQGPEDWRPFSYGAWSKVLRLDRHRGELELYRGAFWRLMAYPQEFQNGLEEAVGPWPGVPDGELLEAWWLDMFAGIDLDTYVEQVERFDRYIDAMAEYAFAHEEFRLLMSYHPTVDEYLHTSLIVSPEQAAYSPGRALAAHEGLKRVGRSVDRSVGTMWRLLEPQRDVLVVVSDHGMLPLHTVVGVNRVLADAELVRVDSRRDAPFVAVDSPLRAVSSGGCSHIYLNLEGREPGGVVRRGLEADELLRRAARALTDLDAEGETVVERILARDELAEHGLDHPASGDLVVFLKPGFATTDALDVPPLNPSQYYGQHGYFNHHPELHGIFFARGAGVRARHPDELPITAVAPMVAGWMAIGFP